MFFTPLDSLEFRLQTWRAGEGGPVLCLECRPYPSDGRGNDDIPFAWVGFFIRRVWRWEDVEYGGAIQGMTAMGL